MAYYSKHYLEEKWEGLKFDMEQILLNRHEDKIPEETVEKVKREMTYYLDAIKKEINK